MATNDDMHFENIDFSIKELVKSDYDTCTFKSCTFTNTDLSNLSFSECEFSGCDLSLVKTCKTSFKGVRFRDCELLGVHFEKCNEFLFSVSFKKCILNMASFHKLGLKKTQFKECILQETDFTECDLTGSTFDRCNMNRAVFSRTILEKVDFRTSYDYSIDPENNRIKKAKFSLLGIVGLLNKYDIQID
jgi:fluoroquinolone resistance protein